MSDEPTIDSERARKAYKIHDGQQSTMCREAEDNTGWERGSAEIVDAYMDDNGDPVLVFEGEPET